ncbi:hypothetical protein KFK09_013190 [Dendrobium nobile]|uniref:Uncharacterized protein n=1 Tax=Dendrobium nobile TaxID=94219 RepID=A0A8T3B8W2_DENNO|nr:hypothetical protein KFK09_013190 [Dendrobium nobile]
MPKQWVGPSPSGTINPAYLRHIDGSTSILSLCMFWVFGFLSLLDALVPPDVQCEPCMLTKPFEPISFLLSRNFLVSLLCANPLCMGRIISYP